MTIGQLVTITVLASLPNAGPRLPAQEPHPDDEQQVGQQVFEELKAKGEIIGSFSADAKSAKPFVAPKNAPAVFMR